MKTRIHVNRHVIASNKKHNKNDPPLAVKTYKENRKCHEATIHGPSKVVYSPDKPLGCGARLWVETESEVTVE